MTTTTCPEAIRRLICGKEYAVDEIGMSGAEILIFDDCVLKVVPYRKENDDTVGMMRWLSGKLPVPDVLCYEQDAAKQYLLMRRLPGRMACDPYYLERPQALIAFLAEALHMLWRVDVSDCPRKGTLDAALRQAAYRVEHGLVDPDAVEPTTFGEGGFRDPQALLAWLEEHRPTLDPVLSHGDFCLPNLFLEDGRISGFVDLGKTGVGDRWNDIALCCRSLKHNLEGAYGGRVYPGVDLNLLFDALGLKPDWEKLKYYTLLDELFYGVPMLQFGMPTLVENRTLEDDLALCSSLGLRFLELNMNFPEYQVERLEQTDSLMRLAEQAGVYYTIHLDENLNVADFNPLVSGAYLETVRRTVLAAKKLLLLRDRFGDRSQPLTLNMHMHHGIHITLPDRKVQMYDRDLDTYLASFVRFRALCEEWIGGSDLLITVENTDGFRAYEKQAIEYLLESPKFGLTWDVGHSKAIKEQDVPFLLAHEARLAHFHIHDATETPPRNHLALGDGELDVRARLRLAESRNARCVLETKTIAALKQSVEWLRREDFL